jgi:hypothetical protein
VDTDLNRIYSIYWNTSGEVAISECEFDLDGSLRKITHIPFSGGESSGTWAVEIKSRLSQNPGTVLIENPGADSWNTIGLILRNHDIDYVVGTAKTQPIDVVMVIANPYAEKVRSDLQRLEWKTGAFSVALAFAWRQRQEPKHKRIDVASTTL